MVSVKQWMMRKYGSGVERTFNKDMNCDGMTFKGHKHIVKTLEQMCDHIWRASVRSVKSARACVR